MTLFLRIQIENDLEQSCRGLISDNFQIKEGGNSANRQQPIKRQGLKPRFAEYEAGADGDVP
jgi:hypothetical protein